MYEEYATICEQIKLLTEKKENLAAAIVDDIYAQGKDSIEKGYGKFTVSKLKKWTYPDSIVELGEEFKAQKVKAEKTGDATFTESSSLRFVPIKI